MIFLKLTASSYFDKLRPPQKTKEEQSGADPTGGTTAGPSANNAGASTGQAGGILRSGAAPPAAEKAGSGTGASATAGVGGTANGSAPPTGPSSTSADANGGGAPDASPGGEAKMDVEPTAGSNSGSGEDIKKRAAEVSKHMENLRAAMTSAVAATAQRRRNAQEAESCVTAKEKDRLETKRNALQQKVTEENTKVKLLIDQLRALHFFLHSMS